MIIHFVFNWLVVRFSHIPEERIGFPNDDDEEEVWKMLFNVYAAIWCLCYVLNLRRIKDENDPVPNEQIYISFVCTLSHLHKFTCSYAHTSNIAYHMMSGVFNGSFSTCRFTLTLALLNACLVFNAINYPPLSLFLFFISPLSSPRV